MACTTLLNNAAYGTVNLLLRIITYFKQVQSLSMRKLCSNPYILKVCVGFIFPTWLDTEMINKELSFYQISCIGSKWQFYQKRSFNHCDPWNRFVKGGEICHSKLCLFSIRIISGWGYLKRKGLSLNSLYLHEDRSSKKDSITINSIQGVHHQKKNYSYHRRLEVDTTPRQALLQTIISPIYSPKGPFISPIDHYCPLSDLHPLSLSPIKTVYDEFSTLTAFWGIHFFLLCDIPMHITLKTSKLV